MLYREAGDFKTSYQQDSQTFPIKFDRWRYYAVLAFAFLVVPFVINDYWANSLLVPFLIYSIAAIGLNILTGYAGQVSLGTGGFMAVGAYACYKLMTAFPEVSIVIHVLIAGGITAFVGVLFGLPSLRIKGFYLAVATLAAQFFLVWLFNKVPWFYNYSASGQINAPERTVLGVLVTGPSTEAWAKYMICLVFVTFCGLLARNLTRGSVGRRWMAIRDMDIAAEIIAEPNRMARKAEEALSLTREQRREIQRALTILDYNTRGIDGIFGPGSRRAIANWQQVNGYGQTTYLTTEQISRLDAQASRRAAELEAEAERKRREEARLDRAYWDETGARGDEPGYRAYLGKYPDGIFSQLAQERLSAIEDQKRAAAEAEDRAAWDSARAGNTVAAYQTYLRAYPDGVFKADAEAQITALTQADSDQADLDAARAQEAALGLNPITARLVEARLQQLGLEPGVVDGRFDDDTRRALRRYQRARDLPVTGYLNEPTVVRLLADSVGVVGR